eukprot:6067196-Prorocentrum_lima.AAC.1
MTSSLVGSEMCIRDSRAPRRAKPARQRPWRAKRARLGELRDPPWRATPVSYTHLKLPTICSV